MTLRKELLLRLSLLLIGCFFIIGGLNELAANLAPELLPTVIQQGLEQSGYGLLHAHPVVKWWTRITNVLNLCVGGALIAGAMGLKRRRAWAPRLTLWALGYVVVVGCIGSIVIVVWLFPVLDELGPALPVSPSGMKASMIAGPAALVFVGFVKARFIRRHREALGGES